MIDQQIKYAEMQNKQFENMLDNNNKLIEVMKQRRKDARNPDHAKLAGVVMKPADKPITCHYCLHKFHTATGSKTLVWDMGRSDYISGMDLMCPKCTKFITVVDSRDGM